MLMVVLVFLLVHVVVVAMCMMMTAGYTVCLGHKEWVRVDRYKWGGVDRVG